MTSANAARPIHLTDALGANLLDADDVAALIFVVGEGDLAQTPDHRADRVRFLRTLVEAGLYGDPLITTRWDGRPWVGESLEPHELRQTAWQADLIEDPALLARVVELVDDDTADEIRVDVDRQRRPFPLLVEPSDEAWLCGACGGEHDAGSEAVTIRGRDGWSELEQPVRYCARCIALVAEAVLLDA